MTNRIYCVDCQVFFRKEKTGFTVEYSRDDRGFCYHIRGDLYVCPKCEKHVYGDFGEPF